MPRLLPGHPSPRLVWSGIAGRKGGGGDERVGTHREGRSVCVSVWWWTVMPPGILSNLAGVKPPVSILEGPLSHHSP